MTVRTVNNLPAATHGETARCLFAIELTKQSWVIGFITPLSAKISRRILSGGDWRGLLELGNTCAGGAHRFILPDVRRLDRPDRRTRRALPSSLVQFRAAVWTGYARDTRPIAEAEGASRQSGPMPIFGRSARGTRLRWVV
jgi:hypothetical protein